MIELTVDMYKDLMEYITFFKKKFPSISEDEIESELNYSIAVAYDRYDESKNVKFKTYVFTIMFNQCKQILRKCEAKKHISPSFYLDDFVEDDEGNTSEYINTVSVSDYASNDYALLLSHLRDIYSEVLTTKQADIFKLYLQGMSTDKIAVTLNTSVNNINRRRTEFIVRLIPYLKEYPSVLDMRYIKTALKHTSTPRRKWVSRGV